VDLFVGLANALSDFEVGTVHSLWTEAFGRSYKRSQQKFTNLMNDTQINPGNTSSSNRGK